MRDISSSQPLDYGLTSSELLRFDSPNLDSRSQVVERSAALFSDPLPTMSRAMIRTMTDPTSGDDRITGTAKDETLRGDRGDDTLRGRAGDDRLLGDAGSDRLVGGEGNDTLIGGTGRDELTGDGGRDRFELRLSESSPTLRNADRITDFTDGKDRLVLEAGLTFNDLRVRRGDGKFSNATLIQHRETGDYLAILEDVKAGLIDSTDVLTAADPGTDPIAAIRNDVTIQFSPSSTEEQIASQKGAKIKLGSQTIYIGTWQASGINQNPIIASFDSKNANNNWVRTDYEMTGADGRGYGLFWDGKALYGIFSVDGTQGSPSEDFRRTADGATQAWLRSYGQGGGSKVSVIAKIDPATGKMTRSAYLSALLSNGNSNTLIIRKASLSNDQTIVLQADSWFSPRRPNGEAMEQVGTGGSPHDYTLEIARDLRTVLSTSAVGWI